MKLLDLIRKQPKEKKVQIIVACAGVCAILLVITWIISSRYNKQINADFSVFETLHKGIKNLSQNYNKPLNP